MLFAQQADGVMNVAQAREVIRKQAAAKLGFEPGDGMLMNFFDDADPSRGNFISREEMFANLKKLRN